jgi:hypothetical protein
MHHVPDAFLLFAAGMLAVLAPRLVRRVRNAA